MKTNSGLTRKRLVELGRVSRSGFYRFKAQGEPGPDPDMELRDAIQRIPARVCHDLATEADPRSVLTMLEGEIRQALELLSEGVAE